MRSYISRTAAFTWSPAGLPVAEPLVATGTLAGALDESFSNESLLEIWKLDYGSGETSQPIAKVPVAARFSRIVWGYICERHPMGVLAAGLESGELALYDAKRLMDGKPDALMLRNNQHTGPIKGLHFNPKQPKLLASGGVNGEIYIWDLSNPGKPYSPGARSAKLDEITALSWHSEVAHILATASSSGFTVVWDLRYKKELAALTYGSGSSMNGAMGGGRRGTGAICWHPNHPTRLATASDDDASPYITLWDLRNTREPEKVIAGHEKGILAMSWCKQDSDLLLSCGKDNRCIIWNPTQGQMVGELPASSNWSYDVQWCPENPNLVAAASFDGRISVRSLQSTNQTDAPVDTSAAVTDPNDIFNSLPAQSEANNRGVSLTQPPKWLRRPIGATFGFGGQLASVSNLMGDKGQTQSAVVHVRNIVTEPSIVSRAQKLQDAIDSQTLAEFCAERSQDPNAGSDELANWKALQTLFQADSRDELVALLGFSKEDVARKVSASISSFRQASGLAASGVSAPGTPAIRPQNETETEDSMASIFGGSRQDSNVGDTSYTSTVGQRSNDNMENGDHNLFGEPDESQDPGNDFFNNMGSGEGNRGSRVKSAVPDYLQPNNVSTPGLPSAAATVGSPELPSHVSDSARANTFRIYPDNESEIDKLVTRAIVLGDFQSAVSLCISADRHADAILLAVRGGPELLAKAQKAYFERKTATLPYLRVFQSIVTDDLSDIVQNADLNDWQEVFVVLCTFAKKNEDFVNLAEQLGQRLEYQYTSHAGIPNAKSFRKNAILCYLAAGKLEKVAGMWVEEMREEESVLRSGQTNGTSSDAPSLYTARAEALQTFMEKIAVFQSAVNYVDADLSQPSQTEEVAAARTYKLGPLYERILEYVEILADQGMIDSALKYIQHTPADYRVGDDDVGSMVRERLLKADQARTGGRGAAAASAVSNVFAGSSNAAAPSAYGAPAQNAYGAYGAQSTSAYQQPQQQAYGAYSGYNAAPMQQNSSQLFQQQPQQAAAFPQQNSAYAPAQPMVPAPPPPIMPDANNAGITSPPAGNLPPPPPRKPDGGWNDIPPSLQPKRSTSAMSNRGAAQPITSPFPNAPAAPSYGAPPQPGPGAGMAPPPRGMLQPQRTGPVSPSQSMTGRPGMGMGGPPRPPPMGPPRGGTPMGGRPGLRPQHTGPASMMPHQQHQQGPGQQQQQQQQSGPYAPQPGRVNAPPPNNNYGPPPPGQQQQQQPGANPSGFQPQQQRPPPPQQGPYGALSPRQNQAMARPPMPPMPAPGAGPQNVPMRSVTPGAGAGPPPQRTATPSRPSLRYPAGDRSHIPDSCKPILNTLNKELARFKSITPPAQKRMSDDADRRVNLLLDLLNCGMLEPKFVQALHGLCQAIEARNQQGALSQHVQLASMAGGGDLSTALLGLKLIISKLNQ